MVLKSSYRSFAFVIWKILKLEIWFCVNLGGNLLLYYLTKYLKTNTLVN